MDFLAGLRKAMSQGISKEEYMSIWSREMELKAANNVAETKIAPGADPGNASSDGTCTEKENVLSLLKQISKQQDSIQQWIKDLQMSHDKQELMMLKRFEETQNNFSWKISAIENSLSNFHESIARCVRTCVHAECLDFEEKLSLMIETFYNHACDEIRNVVAGNADGFNKTLFGAKSRGEKQVRAKGQVLQESDEKVHIKTNTEETWDNASDANDQESNDFVSEEPVEVPQSKIDVKTNMVRNDISMTDSEASSKFKQILHSELNTFLVHVQKLLLKPISSKDIGCYFTEEMKKLLQFERNITADQLFNIQTAISSDAHVRFSKMEISIKQELERLEVNLKQHKKIHCKVCKIHEDIHYLQNLLSSELPKTIASNIKLVTTFEDNTSANLVKREASESGAQHDDTQRPIHHRQSEIPMQEENNLVSDGKEVGQTNSSPKISSCEQMQTMTIMLSMYRLMLLLYKDILGSKRPHLDPNAQEAEPQLKSPSCSTTPADLPLETSPASLNSIKAHIEPASFENTQSAQPRRVINHLTDAHFKLMFEQYKEFNFLCHIDCSRLAAEENISISLPDIDPGYNLLLKANMANKAGHLKFFILAVNGPQDESLVWPAVFNIKIKLDYKHSVVRSKNEDSYTKRKQLDKPRKLTGQSTLTPICYFRKEIFNKYVHKDSLDFTVSVSYIRGTQEDITDEL